MRTIKPTGVSIKYVVKYRSKAFHIESLFVIARCLISLCDNGTMERNVIVSIRSVVVSSHSFTISGVFLHCNSSTIIKLLFK